MKWIEIRNITQSFFDFQTGLYAPVHQHFFVARLDMAVDGTNNKLYEQNCVTLPPSTTSNPHANAFYFAKTPLSTEREAIRDLNPTSGRFWTVESQNRTFFCLTF